MWFRIKDPARKLKKGKKMLLYTKSQLKPFLFLDILSEIHKTKERISFFKNRYKQNFIEFSNHIKNNTENFEKYDDYIEWKAYEKNLKFLMQNYQDLKDENFKVA